MAKIYSEENIKEYFDIIKNDRAATIRLKCLFRITVRKIIFLILISIVIIILLSLYLIKNFNILDFIEIFFSKDNLLFSDN